MRPILVVAAAILLAGCSDAEKPQTAPTPGATAKVEAPWWELGEWWDVSLSGAGIPTQTVRLVHYWNDSDTKHFWLGVRDRNVARDHALHDTNPLLGRIHWGLLTPHEKGIHAHGLYTFPTEPGKKFGGLAFGKQWEIEAAAGPKTGALTFTGRSTDRDTISYDYDPETRWFSAVEIKDRSGATTLSIRVTGHGLSEKGAFHFHRGLDFYLGPAASGTHDETFTVKPQTEGKKVAFLAVEVIGAPDGPLRLDFLDPTNAIKRSYTLPPGTAVNEIIEIPDPAEGEWTIKYVGTGSFDGTIEVVGIEDFGRSV